MTLLATFKHISSKNADYGAAEAYLTFEHDEFTMKPTLDENGRLMGNSVLTVSGFFKQGATDTAADKMMKVLEAEAAAGHTPPFSA